MEKNVKNANIHGLIIIMSLDNIVNQNGIYSISKKLLKYYYLY